MVHLRLEDVRPLLDAVDHRDDGEPERRVQAVLEVVDRLIRCDEVFWTRLATGPLVRRIVEVGLPRAPALGDSELERCGWSEWVSHRDEHPVMSGRYGPIVALSDVYQPVELRRTWLYERYWRPAGVRHEIGVHLTHPAQELHVVFLTRREGPDFDERDRTVLRLVRPHLDAALRRLVFSAPPLTARQAQILRLVRDGLTDGQIATRLGICEDTVGKHLEHVYARSGARSRAHAVALYADLHDS